MNNKSENQELNQVSNEVQAEKASKAFTGKSAFSNRSQISMGEIEYPTRSVDFGESNEFPVFAVNVLADEVYKTLAATNNLHSAVSSKLIADYLYTFDVLNSAYEGYITYPNGKTYSTSEFILTEWLQAQVLPAFVSWSGDANETNLVVYPFSFEDEIDGKRLLPPTEFNRLTAVLARTTNTKSNGFTRPSMGKMSIRDLDDNRLVYGDSYDKSSLDWEARPFQVVPFFDFDKWRAPFVLDAGFVALKGKLFLQSLLNRALVGKLSVESRISDRSVDNTQVEITEEQK